MNRLVSLGLFGLLSALAFSACSDDEDTGPGVGGSGGAAGSDGTAGTGGAAGGGAGGTGGDGAGGTGSQVACTGCVEIAVAVTAADQAATPPLYQAAYQFTFPAPGVDLSNATVTWRVQVVAPDANFFVQPIVQNGAALNYQGNFPGNQALTPAAFPAGEWVDVVQNLATLPGAISGDAGVGDAGGSVPGDAGAADPGDAEAPPPAPGGFDKSQVESVSLQVGVTSPNVGTVRILIDSVTFTGVDATAVPNKTFDAGVEGLTLNTFQAPPGAAAPVAH